MHKGGVVMEQKTVSFELRVLGNLIRRQAAQSEIRRHVDDLTGTNGWVIGFIADHEGQDIFQRDLEVRFSIRRSTATKILQLMEKKGLLERQSVAYDARLKKLVLTPKALELHKLATEDMRVFEQRLTHGLSKEELEAFFHITDKMKKNLIESGCCEASAKAAPSHLAGGHDNREVQL
jgi:MarR family transcriptional repressor of mepA